MKTENNNNERVMSLNFGRYWGRRFVEISSPIADEPTWDDRCKTCCCTEMRVNEGWGVLPNGGGGVWNSDSHLLFIVLHEIRMTQVDMLGLLGELKNFILCRECMGGSKAPWVKRIRMAIFDASPKLQPNTLQLFAARFCPSSSQNMSLT